MVTAERDLTPGELSDKLETLLRLHDGRAVIGVIVAPAGRRLEVTVAVHEALERVGSKREAMEFLVVSATQTDRLVALNRERDLLLRDRRAVILVAESAEAARHLRRTAPDLTAAPDLWVELPSVEGPSDWTTTARAIRQCMQVRHETLDLTGLLPANAEHRTVALNELYMPLVEIDLGPATSGEGAEGDAGTRGRLVLGHPGTGKTTYLRHVAFEYAIEASDPLSLGRRLLPVLVPLADYGLDRERNRVRPLVDFLPDWLTRQGVRGAEAFPAHLEDVVLLLDGLDEMRDPGARREVLDEVGLLVQQGRVAAAVVTGRSFLVDELKTEDTRRLPIVRSREPSPGEIQKFLEHFTRLRRGTPEAATDLARRIQADSDLRALARTPLLLAFMALLDDLEGRLPDRRVEIYWRLGEMLVDRWTKARSLGEQAQPRRRASRGHALRVLGPLAWWVVERGGGAVDEGDLRETLVRIEAGRDTRQRAEARVTTLLDLLRYDTALLVPQGGRRWAFVHSSVAEYFAAVEAARGGERWGRVLGDPFRADWREIVLFAAGYLGVVEGNMERLDELAAAVLRRSTRRGRYDVRHPSLIIGLLQEEPGFSGQQLRELIRRLLRYLFVNAFPPAKARQVQLEAVDFLLDAASRAYRGIVAEELSRWFRPEPAGGTKGIRWARVLAGADEDWEWALELADHLDAVILEESDLVGELAAALPGLLEAFGISSEALLRHWRGATDERLRFVGWMCSLQREPPDQRRRLIESERGFISERLVRLLSSWYPEVSPT